ncbi:MAG: ABC transporter substrate-binding protein [Elusimicrobia bacterium RIFCSPLOWO2_01_FULL_54_10]|nr:MAG: ABC transporter substrate-binding protein [Elusimicrobia bacterium RIFCSPLOWO2_01_FULL_54_10]
MNCFKGPFLFSLAFFAASLAQSAAVVKFATLAPEGSTWMNVMKEWNQELEQKSGGELKFRFYAGGISGDEKDMVKKIRFGQLHSGGFTGVGLGEIAPEARILDAPFLFKTSAEADHIYQAFDKEWRGAFEKNGYVLLGWAEVGFIYFFSNTPVRNLQDLKGVKMWMWEGDPIAEVSFKTMGVHPVPLSITDVMTSLQTGLIDGVYSSPLAILALQWFTKTKFMSDFQLANASGAVLISKKSFDALPKVQQDLLLATGKKYLSQLTHASRKENIQAIEALKRNGIQVTSLQSPDDARKFEDMGRSARKALVGRLYSQDLLDKVEKSLQEFRSKPKK